MPRILGLLLLIVPLTAPAAPVPTHLMPKPNMMTFPIKVGTKWVYQHGEDVFTMTVSSVTLKEKTAVIHISQTLGDAKIDPITIEVRTGGWFWTHIGDAPINPPSLQLKLPYLPGDVWENRGAAKSTCTIRKRELITVPAGTFDAVRVESEYTGPQGHRRTSIHWYADGVGEVKRTDWAGPEKTLTSFTLGK